MLPDVVNEQVAEFFRNQDFLKKCNERINNIFDSIEDHQQTLMDMILSENRLGKREIMQRVEDYFLTMPRGIGARPTQYPEQVKRFLEENRSKM